MCIDAEKRMIYVFGGKVLTPRSVSACTSSETEYSGLFSYHIATNTWTQIPVGCHHPSASLPDVMSVKSRITHCMVFHNAYVAIVSGPLTSVAPSLDYKAYFTQLKTDHPCFWISQTIPFGEPQNYPSSRYISYGHCTDVARRSTMHSQKFLEAKDDVMNMMMNMTTKKLNKN
ncbi:uncharacterized protein ACN427_013124 [Glossina fuscipes fuscipes]